MPNSRQVAAAARVERAPAPSAPLIDTLRRPLRDLRISVTDHCNFRCVYCMPKAVFGTPYRFVSHDGLLRFDEIARLTRVFAALGVSKVRLTGGEPLLRPHLEDLLRSIHAVDGICDLALTTNGALLTREKAALLRAAGLGRITVSLDSLREDVFQAMNDVGFPAAQVLAAIDHAAAAGLPVKINMVVRRGLNDDDIVPMARQFRGSGHVLRFIEYMDVGNLNGWRPDDVVPAREIFERIAAVWPLDPLSPARFGEVAQRYTYRDGAGEIGIIASITQPFCRTCTRARLSPEGQLFTCLFGDKGRDLRALLRSTADDATLQAEITGLWRARADRYSDLRASQAGAARSPKVEMFHIGG